MAGAIGYAQGDPWCCPTDEDGTLRTVAEILDPEAVETLDEFFTGMGTRVGEPIISTYTLVAGQQAADAQGNIYGPGDTITVSHTRMIHDNPASLYLTESVLSHADYEVNGMPVQGPIAVKAADAH